MSIRLRQEENEYIFLSPYASKSRESLGRDREEQMCDIRTIYQQDRDRIIHSKSFRRLKHKTQVFISADIGDHYRTRLTHTLEVAQIARTIARGLRLNEDLAEAIALGHDLGHTPFGHAGEEVLDEISRVGFKHNEQSLRVVEVLERDSKGLNLSKEVRDGIVNHNGGNTASTLEGKIIKLADRIAYINHDIDDGVRSGMLKLEEIPERFLAILGQGHSERISTLVIDIINESTDKNDICQSKEIAEAMLGLRKFLFENLYNKTDVNVRMSKGKNLIRKLYEYYMLNIEGQFSSEEERERAVLDYISGMTDSYAIQRFKELYLP
jgi:dGTPase